MYYMDKFCGENTFAPFILDLSPFLLLMGMC